MRGLGDSRPMTHRSFCRRCIVLLLALAPVALGVAQSTPLVPWDADTLLTWSSFQGTPPSNASQLAEVAAIHMTVKWHADFSVCAHRSGGYSWLGTVQDVVVSNTMNPRFSWVISSKATPAVLHHEQLHFDLNEAYRRKLELELSSVQVQGTTGQGTLDALDAKIKQTAKLILDDLSAMQTRFDQETSNGQNLVAQAQWEANIATWLVNPALVP